MFVSLGLLSPLLPDHQIKDGHRGHEGQADAAVEHGHDVGQRQVDHLLVNEIVEDDVEDVGHQGLDEDEVGLAEAVEGGDEQEAEREDGVSGRQVVDEVGDGFDVLDVKDCRQKQRPGRETSPRSAVWFLKFLS